MNRFFFSSEFSKLCLIIEAKIITVTNVALNIYRLFKIVICGEGEINREKVSMFYSTIC